MDIPYGQLIQGFLTIAAMVGIVVKVSDRIKTAEIKIAMLEKNDEKQDSRYEELNAKLDTINNTVIRIATVLDTIQSTSTKRRVKDV